jgi:hypothetical protein
MAPAPKEMKYYVYYGNCVPASDPGGATTNRHEETPDRLQQAVAGHEA